MTKSKFLRIAGVYSQDFREDLKTALTFNTDQIALLIQWIKERLEPGAEDTELEFQAISERIGRSGQDITQFARMASFWSDAINEYKDEPETIANDLVEMKQISESEKEALLSFLKKIAEAASGIESARKITSYETLVLPRIKSFSWSMELRAVERDRYDKHKHGALNEFTIEIEHLVPVAIIKIVMKSPEKNESCVMQLNKKTLSVLVEGLQEITMEFDVLQKLADEWRQGKCQNKK